MLATFQIHLSAHPMRLCQTSCCICVSPLQTKHFTILIPEGRPEGAGFDAAATYAAAGIPVRVILDSAVGYFMEQVNLCVVGAEGVVENGGVVNKVGASSAL